jgi:DNA/RNA endonuclease YhcR with UshA esterase domain
MKRISLVLVTAIAMLMTGARVDAHHSFAGTYVMDKEITIKGTLTQFTYRNPHSFLKIDVKDDKGQVTAWLIEWGGGGQLAKDNVTRDTLKPGDQLVVVGNEGRDTATHHIRIRTIMRPSDGWKWDSVFN